MRTSRLVAVGVVGIAALWTAGWFAGRSLYVAPEAENTVAELRAGSLFFTFQRRSIGGFPFSYEVSYEDVALSSASGLWRLTAPRLSAGAGLSDTGKFTLRPAPASKLIVEPAAFAGGAGDAPMVFDIDAEAPEITLAGDGERASIALRAAALTATQAAGEGILSGARLQFAGLALDGAYGGGAGETELKADAVEIAYRLAPDQVSETSATIRIQDLEFDFDGAALDAESFADFITRDGAAEATLKTGGYEIAGAGSGGPSRPPFKLNFAAASSEIAATIREGRARYAATAADILYAMERDPPAGGAAIGAFSAMLDMPIRRGAAPYRMTLSIGGLTPDEIFWKTTDPAGAISRTPIGLELDFAGTARILADLGGRSFSQPPIDVETLEIRALRAEGLGLEAEATGALDIAGDASMPDGDLSLNLKGALALIGDLAAAGLIPQGAAAIYTGVALEYARSGDGPDHLIADISVSDGAMKINGRPLR